MSIETYKKLVEQNDSKVAILKGVNSACDLVAKTLGHSSRRIILDQQFGELISSDDGSKILSEIELEDRVENLGVKILAETAAKTDSDTGDGTSSTSVIFRELLNQLLKTDPKENNLMIPKSGANVRLRKEIRSGLEKVIKYINENKVEVTDNEQLRFVARVSSNSKEVGDILADIFSKLGKDGAVSVEEGHKTEIEYSITEGFSLNQGWIAPQFITDAEREESILQDGVNILVSNKKIQDIDDIKTFVDLVKSGRNNFLIIAPDVSGAPLNMLVVNKMMGNLRVAAIKAPPIGDVKDTLLDICSATGATLIGDDIQFSELNATHLGSAERIVVSKDKTIIVGFGGSKEKINERVSQIRHRIENQSSDYEKKKLEERISKLTSGVGSIKVGGHTPIEIKDKKAKIDDAVGAVRSALKDGVVEGGGVCLLKASTVLGDSEGEQILKKAIIKPFKQILENSDIFEDYTVKVLETGLGYDTENHEFVDMFKNGLIDPAGVVKSAINNATTAALTISNIGGSVTLIRKTSDNRDSIDQ